MIRILLHRWYTRHAIILRTVRHMCNDMPHHQQILFNKLYHCLDFIISTITGGEGHPNNERSIYFNYPISFSCLNSAVIFRALDVSSARDLRKATLTVMHQTFYATKMTVFFLLIFPCS